MANMELIRQGYTLIYTILPNVKYINFFQAAREDARITKAGLWKDLKQIYPNEAKKNIGHYCLIKGKVNKIYTSTYKIHLIYGEDKTRHLTGIIYYNNIPFFIEIGIDPISDYKGKKIELIGKIEDKKGSPQVIIDNPSQIKMSR